MAEHNYGADSIEFLKGLETVRTRPTMYIGAVSGKPSDGLYRLFREALDNAIDEYLAGYNKNIWVFYNTKTKQTTVVDNGRGIPVGWNEKAQMNSLTLVFTQLHAGGKFNHEAYKTSSGLNGIGQKAIAALSNHLQVWSNNSSDNWFYTQTFEKGNIKSDVARCRLPEAYKNLIKKKGTIVQWTPDETIFTDSTDLDLHRLKKELGDIQYLCPGLHIHLLIDDNEEIEYYSEKGLTELVSQNENDTIFTYQDDFTDVAVNFTKQDGNTFKSFVNVCYTNLGGTHLNGLKKTICNVVKSNSKKKILNDDIMEGVIGAIHHKMSDPQYQGQTKNELTNTPVEKEIVDKLTQPLEKFFRKNKDLLNRIVEYAEKMYEQKEKMKASKDLLKGLKTLNAGSRYISDKFLDADRRKYKNPKDLEMFIVEGDSAGGHFKNAREGFQGELKLKGKIINAAKSSPEELFGKPQKKGETKCDGNREIKDLVASLGCGIQDDYDESKLRFGKVILLCFDGETKVKMLDGTNKTFEELVKYEKEHPDSDYWVYSVDENGIFVPGKAKHPRITGYTKELIKLTFDNGETIKCTPEHLFMLRDGTYKEAKDITETDSLMPIYTKLEESDFCKNHEKIFNNLTGKWEFTHQKVSKYYNGETPKGYNVHHKDLNALNNTPDNLLLLGRNEHMKLHANTEENISKIIAYNKSKIHKERMSELWKNTNTYKNATFNANGYNGSKLQSDNLKKAHKKGKYKGTSHFIKYNKSSEAKELHKKQMIDMNKNEQINKIRLRNKLINVGMILSVNEFNLSKELFNDRTKVRNFIGFCPDIKIIEENFKTFENYKMEVNNALTKCAQDALNILKEKRYNCNFSHEDRIKSNVFTKKNGMARIGKTVLDRGLELNEINYMTIRKELGSIRVPKYENYVNYFENETIFKEYCKNYNHKIVKKEIITYETEIPVYDLTVEKYNNFAIELNGSGVIVHNCDADSDGGHISNLCTAFFVNYMPDLIKNGHLYIIDAPLFVANGSKTKAYGMTRKEVENKMKAQKCSDYTITRLKGWGECTPEQLSEICLNPKTRKLIQVKWTDATEKACEDTMGEGTAFRKELLGIDK